MADGSEGTSATTYSLFRTTDGGATWKAYSVPTDLRFPPTSLFALDEGAVWIGSQSPEAASVSVDSPECGQRLADTIWVPVIFRLSHPTAAWSREILPKRNGCETDAIHFSSPKRGVSVSHHTVFYTQDGGDHWRESSVEMKNSNVSWPKANGSAFGSLSFLEQDGSIGWLSYDGGELFSTRDAGEHWKQVLEPNSLGPRNVGFGAWGATYFANEKIGWILGGGAAIYETQDGGSTWSKIACPDRILSLSCRDGSCLLASANKLFRIDWNKRDSLK